MSDVKKFALGSAAFLVIATAFVLDAVDAFSTDPGPIPTCNGEQATHVLVKYGTIANYQEWMDQGVIVVQDPDNAMRGTWGHDVMVTLVETSNGGLISTPLVTPETPFSTATAGDFMCSAVPGADDIYYATRGRSDVILDSGGGSDNYFLGGCSYEGAGTPGDRGCDRLVSTNGAHDDIDRIWGFTVPKGRTQRIILDDSMDHNYVGKGAGKVFIDGGGAPAHANGGGDHVHPCPINSSDPKYLSGLEGGFTKNRIQTIDIEYFGPEGEFLPRNQIADPCAYQDKNI